jgi:hypothetical protein
MCAGCHVAYTGDACTQGPVLSPVVLSLSTALYAAHAPPTSTRRDPHIQSTAHTLDHLGVTDNTLATASNYNKFYLLINVTVESPSYYLNPSTNNATIKKSTYDSNTAGLLKFTY